MGNEAIDEKDKFVYLFSVISKDCADDDVLNKTRLASVAFGSLRHIWKILQLFRQFKLRIFNFNVNSVLLYGCKTWMVIKSLTNHLQVFVKTELYKMTCQQVVAIWKNKLGMDQPYFKEAMLYRTLKAKRVWVEEK